MLRLYSKFKTEINTISAIIFTLILTVGTMNKRPSFMLFIQNNSKDIILSVLIIILFVYAIYIKRKIKNINDNSFSEIKYKMKKYNAILDEATSCYMFFGMSSEELQKNVPVVDYISGRDNTGKSLKTIKILLLHPNCSNFKNRLEEVNPSRNIDALTERKINQIMALKSSFRALKHNQTEIEIRFVESYPIWLMQFISTTEDDKPDKLYLTLHLKKKHAKFSQQYIIENNNPLFQSFLIYFNKEWENAYKFCHKNTIPPLIRKVSTIKIIILDFDGIVADSNKLKKDILFSILNTIDGYQEKKFIEYYNKNKGLPRRDLISYALKNCTTYSNTSILNDLEEKYKKMLLKNQQSIKPIEEVVSFCLSAKKQYKMFIVSNAQEQEIKTWLEKQPIANCFSSIYGHPVTKTYAIQDIIKTENCHKENIVFIGDSREDFYAAEATGVLFFMKQSDEIPFQHSMKQNIFHSFMDIAFKLSNL